MTGTLEEFKEKQEGLALQLDAAGQTMRDAGYNGASDGFFAQAQQSRDFRFRIAVVGEFSTGKSTLLNAFLGQPLLPAKMPPCTAAPVEILFGETPSLRVYREGVAQPEERPIEDLATLIVLKTNSEEDIARERAASGIIRLEILAPLEMCRNRVSFLDTPGLNEAAARTSLTLEQLPRADAAIFMTSANQLLSKTERDFIEHEASKAAGDRRWMECAFVCASFADVALESGELDELRVRLDTFCDGLSGVAGLAKGRRYFVDARSIVQGSSGKPTRSDGVDFARLVAELEKFVVNERGAAGLHSQMIAAHRLMAHAGSQIQAEKQHLASETAEVRARAEQAKTALKKERERLDRMVRALRATATPFARDLKAEFGSAAAKWIGRELDTFAETIEYPDSVIVRVEPPSKWYAAEFGRWLEDRMQSWSNEVPPARLRERIEQFEQSFRDDLAEMKQNLRGVGVALGVTGLFVEDENENGLEWLARSAVAYAAGGPVAVMVGSAMGWSGILTNLGINFALGFAAAFVGLAIPLVGWVAIAAAIGALQLLLGQTGIKKRIRDKVLEGLREKLPPKLEEAEAAVAELARNGLEEVATAVLEAGTSIISELEASASAAEAAASATAADKAARLNVLEAAASRLATIERELTGS